MKQIEIHMDLFEEIQKALKNCTEKDDFRPELKMIHVSVDEENATFVSCDGWKATKITTPHKNEGVEPFEGNFSEVQLPKQKPVNGKIKIGLSIEYRNMICVSYETEDAIKTNYFDQKEYPDVLSKITPAGEFEISFSVNNLMGFLKGFKGENATFVIPNKNTDHVFIKSTSTVYEKQGIVLPIRITKPDNRMIRAIMINTCAREIMKCFSQTGTATEEEVEEIIERFFGGER